MLGAEDVCYGASHDPPLKQAEPFCLPNLGRLLRLGFVHF
jgi:hypothetical protein